MSFRLDSFLRHFESVRARTRRVAACIPADRVEWAPRSGMFTPGDLVRHIAVTERYIYAETVQENPSGYVTHGRELADGKDAVLALLERMHEESMAIFRALTPEQLERTCPVPGGANLVAWRWLQMMPEHEIHHRGQLYTTLGCLGVDTPPLYGLTSETVRTLGLTGRDSRSSS